MQIKHMTHKPRHSAPYTSLAGLFQNFILHAREMEGRDRLIHRFFPDLDRSIELLREKGNFNLLSDELGEIYVDDWLSKTSFLRKIPGYMELKLDCELKSILGQASIWLRPPLDIALRAMEASLLQWYIVKRLLDQGANPNEIYGDTSSICLLYLRSLEGQEIHPKGSVVVYDIIRMLLKCGVDSNVDLGGHHFLSLMSIYFTMTEDSDLEDLRLLHKQCFEQTQERMEEEMQERVWEGTQEGMQEEVQEELQEELQRELQERIAGENGGRHAGRGAGNIAGSDARKDAREDAGNDTTIVSTRIPDTRPEVVQESIIQDWQTAGIEVKLPLLHGQHVTDRTKQQSYVYASWGKRLRSISGYALITSTERIRTASLDCQIPITDLP